jgi:hypothetical protein
MSVKVLDIECFEKKFQHISEYISTDNNVKISVNHHEKSVSIFFFKDWALATFYIGTFNEVVLQSILDSNRERIIKELVRLKNIKYSEFLFLDNLCFGLV